MAIAKIDRIVDVIIIQTIFPAAVYGRPQNGGDFIRCHAEFYGVQALKWKNAQNIHLFSPHSGRIL